MGHAGSKPKGRRQLSLSALEPAGSFPNTRPKDAATLIVIRRDSDALRVLMGRRSDAQVFMPGAVVFPGGRVERADGYAPALDELHPAVAAKLGFSARIRNPMRARAIAMAAIRETYEETGVLIGRRVPGMTGVGSNAWAPFREAGVVPALAPMRLIARAVTPPRRVRRFDTWFLAIFADAIAAEVEAPDNELQSPAWLSFEQAQAQPVPSITRAVLESLEKRLQRDPSLAPDGPVPFHSVRRGKQVVEEL